MDYEKKYKKALERAKKGECLENIFPELKESEDDKIRKGLIQHLQELRKSHVNLMTKDTYDSWIAWLEKQGKTKPVDEVAPKFKVGDWVIRSAEGFKHNTYLVTEVKDYYICKDLKGRRVTFTFNDVHKNFKLWTIQDAKDGDVLKEDSCVFIIEKMKSEGTGIVYCCLFDDDVFDLIGSTLVFDVVSTQPATKE